MYKIQENIGLIHIRKHDPLEKIFFDVNIFCKEIFLLCIGHERYPLLPILALNIASCFCNNCSESDLKNAITAADVIVPTNHSFSQNAILLSINCEAAVFDKRDIRSDDNVSSIHSLLKI